MSKPTFADRDRVGHGDLAERRAARRLGMMRHPASGALEGKKGDMSNDDFVLESKSTVNESFSIKRAVLEKIDREASADGKKPGLLIQFVDGAGNPKMYGRWVMVRETDFQEMFD